MEPWNAVVLSGGRGSRLGGQDKGSVEYAGTTLLEHALAVVEGAAVVVVVGPRTETSRPVRWTREEPAYGGPVAGLLAGVAALEQAPGDLVVLAVDLPHVTAATVDRLRAARGSHDAAYLVDDQGRRQVAGVHAAGSLRPGGGGGTSLRALLRGLDVVDVPATAGETADVDTWSDVERLRRT